MSGISAAGAPQLERTFHLAHATLTAIVFVVPGIVGLVLEPPLFLLADRYPRRWFLVGGLAAMAAFAAISAMATAPWLLACAISLMGVASGMAMSVGEATLIDLDPEHRGRTMARWGLSSLIGDAAAPLLLAALALAGTTWRTAYAILAVGLAAWGLALARQPLPERVPDAASPGLVRAFLDALRDGKLVAWLFASALCNLLDEILVVFSSIRVAELGGGPTEQGAQVVAFIAGGGAGLVVLDRLLRRWSERTLLIASTIACTIVYASWLAIADPWPSAIVMLLVGATAAPLYPLATARTYACRPEASGSVLAAGHLFTPLTLALPWLLGLAADQWGTQVALVILLAQPVGVGVIAATVRP